MALAAREMSLRASGTKTLGPLLPARVTEDIDLALRVSLFGEPAEISEVAAFLDSEGLEVIKGREHFQFRGKDERGLMVDLLSRVPERGEPGKVRGNRVKSATPGLRLHATATPEAFATECLPERLDVGGGTLFLVAHPYALLNLKVMAARDFVAEMRGELPAKASEPGSASRREKHCLDVVRLIHAITERQLAESNQLASDFEAHSVAQEIRCHAREIFGSEESAAWLRASERAAIECPGLALCEHTIFWQALETCLGSA
jgi:hypothetical protein